MSGMTGTMLEFQFLLIFFFMVFYRSTVYGRRFVDTRLLHPYEDNPLNCPVSKLEVHNYIGSISMLLQQYKQSPDLKRH